MEQIERNPLQDLLDQKKMEILKNKKLDIVFPVYKDKKEIGENIFRALNDRLIDLGNGKLGIPMDDSEKKTGLLSQCQGLQTLVSLVNDFDLKFDSTEYDTKNHRSIRNIMDAILEDIINELRVSDIDIKEDDDDTEDTRELFKFSASPYDSDHFNTDIASIETITWVLPTFFQILLIHVKEKQICKWERNLVRIIRYGIRYLNDSFIDGSDNPNGKGLKIGWNFTKGCEEPSLYFTFAVGECFIDMYDMFKDVLKHQYNVKYNKDYHIPIDKKDQQEYEEQKELYLIEEAENANLPKDKARHDEYNELVRLFRMINSNDSLENQDPSEEISIDVFHRYGLLETNLNNVAKAIWEFAKENLADKFFYNDLATQLTEGELRMSTTSDALFNSVYIVNILIDGGMDETLLLEMRQAEIDGKENEASEKRREYENLLESCQLAIQRAFRTYESLKNDGKEYIVDQFLIGFNERFVKHKEIVNDLRKLRMRVFSLLPMLIHTNNVINTYLVKYPQFNMQKYVGYILANRYTEDRKTEWIWEKDGYFSGSNYYYVNCLKEFYDYYQAYEKKYIDIGEKKQEREHDFYQKLIAPNGEITLLKDKHQKEQEKKERHIINQENIIKSLEQELEEEKLKKPTIEDGIRELIQDEIKQQFLSQLTQTFIQASEAMAPQTVDPTEDKDEAYSKMFAAMIDMVVANIYAKNKNFKECTLEEYQEETKNFKKDLREIINLNAESVSDSVDHHSSMYKAFNSKK